MVVVVEVDGGGGGGGRRDEVATGVNPAGTTIPNILPATSITPGPVVLNPPPADPDVIYADVPGYFNGDNCYYDGYNYVCPNYDHFYYDNNYIYYHRPRSPYYYRQAYSPRFFNRAYGRGYSRGYGRYGGRRYGGGRGYGGHGGHGYGGGGHGGHGYGGGHGGGGHGGGGHGGHGYGGGGHGGGGHGGGGHGGGGHGGGGHGGGGGGGRRDEVATSSATGNANYEYIDPAYCTGDDAYSYGNLDYPSDTAFLNNAFDEKATDPLLNVVDQTTPAVVSTDNKTTNITSDQAGSYHVLSTGEKKINANTGAGPLAIVLPQHLPNGHVSSITSTGPYQVYIIVEEGKGSHYLKHRRQSRNGRNYFYRVHKTSHGWRLSR